MSSKAIDKKFVLPRRYIGGEKNVWVEFMHLVREYQPVNLGTGFPDYSPPKFITEALVDVANRGNTEQNNLLHQYTRDFGHPRLITVLAKLYSGLIGREICPETEVLVTCGAYEALFVSISGHVDVGDEVILIEPAFDCYEPLVRSAGGVTVFVSLHFQREAGTEVFSSDDWVLDKVELENKFNSKTKAIVLNSPNNPLGKVFTHDELSHIANLCKKWNVLCISDEVYEWIVYKPNKHLRIASFPGMWERTITIGSVGKSFSVTGWKLGWAYGPANLMVNLQIVHQNSIYTGNTPIQEAAAIGFEKELRQIDSEESYFNSLPTELLPKKDFIIKILREAGMKPIVPAGGYFVVADFSSLEPHIDLTCETDQCKDYRFTKWLIKNVGLMGIPISAFYSMPHKRLYDNYIRFCFFKKMETLQKAESVLKLWSKDHKMAHLPKDASAAHQSQT